MATTCALLERIFCLLTEPRPASAPHCPTNSIFDTSAKVVRNLQTRQLRHKHPEVTFVNYAVKLRYLAVQDLTEARA